MEEAFKETSVFMGELVQELTELRESTVQKLNALQSQQEALQEQIRRAEDDHQTVSSLCFI